MTDVSLKILLVEDSRTDSFLIQRIMRENPAFTSHILIVQETMQQAKDYLDNNRGHVRAILLDLGLPDTVDAEDSYNQIRLHAPLNVPVIVLTSIDDEGIAKELLKLGAYDFICKSDILFCPSRLGQVISYAIPRKPHPMPSVRSLMQSIENKEKNEKTLH